jgi:energy-coupling factor transporter ATP-binding protein EcfA2
MSLLATPRRKGSTQYSSPPLFGSVSQEHQRNPVQTNMIPKFIEDFEKTDSYPPIILQNRSKIIQTLRKLDSMIEMVKVKESFIAQIKLMLLLAAKGVPLSFKKMHAVFYGPPGVGKSTVAKMVADIWSKMGILNNHKKCKDESFSENDGIQIIRGMSSCTKLSHVCDSLYESIQLLDKLQAPDEEKIEIYSLCRKANEICYELRTNLCPKDSICDEEELSFLDRHPVDQGYVTVGREDFIAGYHGHTLEKTKKLLDSHRGKVIIIEEAYLLFTSQDDSFGMEALTMINRYMDEFAEDYIFIFIGYKEQLERSIFTAQPGLRRRIQWSFEIDAYSSPGLATIFKKQVENSGWSIDVTKLDLFFSERKDKFMAYGGDTERLLLQCQLAYANIYFSKPNLEFIINRKVLDAGYEKYLESCKFLGQEFRGELYGYN